MMHLRHFLTTTRALAAVEFALLLPLLITLTFGTAEVARYEKTAYHFNAAAVRMAQTYAALDGSLSSAAFHAVFDIVQLIFPELLADSAATGTQYWNNPHFTYLIRSIAFIPNPRTCTNLCNGTTEVVSYVGASGVCGAISQAPGLPTATTLPFTSDSMMVVDLTYAYQPMFGTTFLGTIKMSAHGIAPTKYVTGPVTLGDGTNCTLF